MKWVKQEHSHGCGHAALAMLTGESYADLVARCETDPNVEGMYERHIGYHLFEAGYAMRPLYRFHKPKRHRQKQQRDPWPPEPFADAHLCVVKVAADSPVTHFVVMLRDGSVLDPLTPEPKRLADYHEVCNVAGVYKVL